MNYPIAIAGIQRELPLFPVNSEMSIAAFIIFGDVEITEKCAAELLKRAPEFDIILTAEAKSIPLAYEMSRQAGLNDYVVARKGVKVYMENVISSEVNSITTAQSQTLYLGQADVEKLRGRRVLIVDDVISTGESLLSIEALCTQAGGEVAGRMAVLAEGDAVKRDDIIFLEELPLFDADGTPRVVK